MLRFMQMLPGQDEQMEKAMEEILRDSDKDQKHTTDYEDLSGDCRQLLQDVALSQASMHLLLDPLTTGTSFKYMFKGKTIIHKEV